MFWRINPVPQNIISWHLNVLIFSYTPSCVSIDQPMWTEQTKAKAEVTCFLSNAAQGPIHSSVAQPSRRAHLLCNYIKHIAITTSTCKSNILLTMYSKTQQIYLWIPSNMKTQNAGQGFFFCIFNWIYFIVIVLIFFCVSHKQVFNQNKVT